MNDWIKIELPSVPEHIDVGLSTIQESPAAETYKLCVPIYIYLQVEDKEQAVAWLQQIVVTANKGER